MIDPHFVLLGALLSLVGSSFYVRAVLMGSASPNKVTWFLWAAMPIIAFLAQLDQGVGLASILTLSVGLGPAFVLASSFVNRASYWQITTLDLACGAISVAAITVWLLLDNPTMAVVMVVAADSVAALPTVVKSWQSPRSERSDYYILAVLNGVIAILTLDSWRVIDWLFPAYVIVVATTIAAIVETRRRMTSPTRVHGSPKVQCSGPIQS
ncbi:UNVERIFIED_CONTAM: hypothetical protein DES50_12032 [Williamsia faeni]